MTDIPRYPLYERTYALYRASPLYFAGAPVLNQKTLNTHAKRLKEQLKGDNVRGVQVDFAAAEDTARLGPLENCTWHMIGDEDAWIDQHRQEGNEDGSPLKSVTSENARGIEINLEYEKTSYNALLLRDPDVTPSPEGFTSLPLLLVKMPGQIREIFLAYLRTAFDAHVAPLKLSSQFIAASLETYFRHLTASNSTQRTQHVIRQLQVQFAFPTVTTLLRHIEITISGVDVEGFVSRGKALENGAAMPFTIALFRYMKQHLALDLEHPKAHISRISCHSLHLGTERLKLGFLDYPDDSRSDNPEETTASQQAVAEFYKSLVREAAGNARFLPNELTGASRDNTPSSSDGARANRRKRAVSNAAASTSNGKRARATGQENDAQDDGDEDMTTQLS